MSNIQRIPRRRFLQSTVATPLVGFLAGLDTSRFVHAADSGLLRLGLIGCGGRGTGAVHLALESDRDVKLVAMGDVFENRMVKSFGLLMKDHSSQVEVPDSRKFIGLDAYQSVLRSGVDAVVLAAPGGFRPLHYAAAVRAGTHCFLEKPVAIDCAGVRMIKEAGREAAQRRLTSVVGFNRRFDLGYHEWVAKIHEGILGTITKVETYWKVPGDGKPLVTREAAEKDSGRRLSELEYQLSNWFFFSWLSGDRVVESLTHGLDIANWAMGSAPQKVRAVAERRELTASHYGDASDYFSAEYTYGTGIHMIAETAAGKGQKGQVGEVITGTKGLAEAKPSGPFIVKDQSGQILWKYSPGEGPRVDPYRMEMVEFIRSIRAGQSLSMIESGADTCLTAIMSRMAAYAGTEVSWEQALRSDEAIFPREPLRIDSTPPTLPDKFGDYEFPPTNL